MLLTVENRVASTYNVLDALILLLCCHHVLVLMSEQIHASARVDKNRDFLIKIKKIDFLI